MNDTATATTSTAPSTPRGVVILDTPIQRASGAVDRITVRHPKAGELRGVSLVNLLQMDVAALQVVLPRVTEPMLTRPEIDALDPADLVQLGTEVSNFLLPKAERAPASPTA